MFYRNSQEFLQQTFLRNSQEFLETLILSQDYFGGKSLKLGALFSIWDKIVWGNFLIFILGSKFFNLGAFFFIPGKFVSEKIFSLYICQGESQLCWAIISVWAILHMGLLKFLFWGKCFLFRIIFFKNNIFFK